MPEYQWHSGMADPQYRSCCWVAAAHSGTPARPNQLKQHCKARLPAVCSVPVFSGARWRACVCWVGCWLVGGFLPDCFSCYGIRE